MSKEKTESALIPQSSLDLMRDALEFIGTISSVKISTQEEYDKSFEILKDVKKMANLLESDRKGLVKPYNDNVKFINDRYKEIICKLNNGEAAFKKAVTQYYQEQERKRLEEQKKIEAQLAEERRKAEEKAAKEREKEAVYRDLGRESLAEKAAIRAEIQETISETFIAPVIENKAKIEGLSFRTKFSAIIENKNEAVKYCLETQGFNGYILLDLKLIEKLANSTKGSIKIPGIKYIEEKVAAVRI